MNNMNRRKFFQIALGGTFGVLGGCGQPVENGEPDPYVSIFPEISEANSEWELSARIRNDNYWEVLVHDVTLIAYSDEGEEVCRKHVGDFALGEPESRSVTVRCNSFPAIIAVTAEESPCDGAKLEIVYWTGTDDQRGKELDTEEIVWESTYQECSESLPPDRVLQNVSTGG